MIRDSKSTLIGVSAVVLVGLDSSSRHKSDHTAKIPATEGFSIDQFEQQWLSLILQLNIIRLIGLAVSKSLK